MLRHSFAMAFMLLNANAFSQPVLNSTQPRPLAPGKSAQAPAPTGNIPSGMPGLQPTPQIYLKPNPLKAEADSAYQKYKVQNSDLQRRLDNLNKRSSALQEQISKSALRSPYFKCIPPAVPVSPAGNVKSEICFPNDGNISLGDSQRAILIIEEQRRSINLELKALKVEIQQLQLLQNALSDTLNSIDQLHINVVRNIKP